MQRLIFLFDYLVVILGVLGVIAFVVFCSVYLLKKWRGQ